MRTTLTTALLFTLALPTTLAAEVVLRRHDPKAATLPVRQAAYALASAAEKIDEPQETLVVPFYEVDTTDPAGTTTLFAVRNVFSNSVDIEVRYQAPDGSAQRLEPVTLAGFETLTRNVRDVAGLPADPDGFARGFIVIVQTSLQGSGLLVGDYFQVDVGNAFATGQRMASLDELCDLTEVRFVDFGEGTELRLLIAAPQGSNPVLDPASVEVHPILEDGTVLPKTEIFTDDFALVVSASDFTGSAFGTLIFDFQNSGGGLVYAEYSADGQFSVGLNGACIVPVP
jgi:hypothetical protein